MFAQVLVCMREWVSEWVIERAIEHVFVLARSSALVCNNTFVVLVLVSFCSIRFYGTDIYLLSNTFQSAYACRVCLCVCVPLTHSKTEIHCKRKRVLHGNGRKDWRTDKHIYVVLCCSLLIELPANGERDENNSSHCWFFLSFNFDNCSHWQIDVCVRVCL